MENELKKVYCCGTFTIFEDKVLMIKHKNGGHWAFPKGHKELNETDKETAIRETKEETGIDVELISNKTYVDDYEIGGIEHKFVTYFVAKPMNVGIKKQIEEALDVEWVPLDDAVSKVTFDNTREVYKEFLNDWKKNNDNLFTL